VGQLLATPEDEELLELEELELDELLELELEELEEVLPGFWPPQPANAPASSIKVIGFNQPFRRRILLVSALSSNGAKLQTTCNPEGVDDFLKSLAVILVIDF
jgi:hypothetical protein